MTGQPRTHAEKKAWKAQYDARQANQYNPNQPNQLPDPALRPDLRPPYQAPKKHTGRNWVLGIVGGFVALIVIGALAGQDPAPTTTPTPDLPTVPAAKATTKAPKPAAEVSAKWVKLTTVTGSANKSSDTITTSGGKLRLTYNFRDTSGYGLLTGAVYILDEGVDLEKDGGIPDVIVDNGGSESTIVRKDAGKYYVHVTTANAKYTVTVEELR